MFDDVEVLVFSDVDAAVDDGYENSCGPHVKVSNIAGACCRRWTLVKVVFLTSRFLIWPARALDDAH